MGLMRHNVCHVQPNRILCAATSNSGSADLLEQLGAYLDVPPSVVPQIVDKANFCFLFAPKFHPAMRHVAKVCDVD